jgi:hypothetical protein
VDVDKQVANTARLWRSAGAAVTVVCQDRQAMDYDYVDECFVLGTHDLPTEQPAGGTLRVVVPDIGDLLPVTTYDMHPGYLVKVVPRLVPTTRCRE